jgi:hypothetical protein
MTVLGIVVLSCDKYSDLWEPYFDLFFRSWPDCPFKIHLAANHKRFEDARVTTLQSGEDTDWSSSIRRSVEQVEQECILFLYDDAFLTHRVPTHRLAAHLEWFIGHGANYLRTRPQPRPDVRVNRDVGLIRPGTPYRTSLFGSIWRKPLIVDLLRDGESAWAFELEGAKRADAHGGFYSTYSPVFSYLHGVERGKWFPWAVASLQRKGARLDLGARPIMSLSETARYMSRVPKGYALRMLPVSLWPVAFELKRSFLAAGRR